jgi:DNA-binding IclR family transcriptional regulator
MQKATSAIQVIERLASLLDALAAQPDSVSLKELSQRTGLHPSTAHRILNDLVTFGLVDRSEPGAYQLGIRLLELGNLVKARLNVRDAALGPMRELHRLTAQPVNLSIRQNDEIVYIERAVSERSGMQVVRAVGGRAPLHLTSVGKLFLAAATRPEPGSPAIRETASPNLRGSSANWRWCAPAAMRATTRNWSWAYGASRPASATMQASSSPACRSRRRPTSCRTRGSTCSARRLPISRLRSVTTPSDRDQPCGSPGLPAVVLRGWLRNQLRIRCASAIR